MPLNEKLVLFCLFNLWAVCRAGSYEFWMLISIHIFWSQIHAYITYSMFTYLYMPIYGLWVATIMQFFYIIASYACYILLWVFMGLPLLSGLSSPYLNFLTVVISLPIFLVLKRDWYFMMALLPEPLLFWFHYHGFIVLLCIFPIYVHVSPHHFGFMLMLLLRICSSSLPLLHGHTIYMNMCCPSPIWLHPDASHTCTYCPSGLSLYEHAVHMDIYSLR